MSSRSGRRRFLRTTAMAVGFGEWAALLPLSPATAAAAKVNPDHVQFSPDLEPIVRLIEETPRAKCPSMMIEQLRKGLPYRNFVAGVALANIRSIGYQHPLAALHSAHELAMDAPAQERLLPIFYALDSFKAHSNDGKAPHFRPLNGKLPTADKAEEELHAAMKDYDPDRAERAVAVMVRTQGAHRVIEPLWHYGARDWSFIGHSAIWTANAWRTLQMIGWQHAEAMLRSMVRNNILMGKGKDKELRKQPYYPNIERVQKTLARLPGDWAQDGSSVDFTKELLALLEGRQTERACELVVTQLAEGKVTAGAVWDGVHLAAGQIALNAPEGDYGNPVHVNTSINALHFAFQVGAEPANRLLILLQAVGWTCLFGRGKPPKELLKITAPKIDDKPEAAIADILALQSERRFDASLQAFAFEQRYPGNTALRRAASRLLPMKATWNPHDVKFPAAMFENCDMVSPMWRPYLVAASTASILGSDLPDNPAMHLAREALRRL